MSDTRDFPRPVGAYLLVQPPKREASDLGHLVIAAGPSSGCRRGDVIVVAEHARRTVLAGPVEVTQDDRDMADAYLHSGSHVTPSQVARERAEEGRPFYIHSDAVVAVVATAAPMSADEAWNHGKVPVAYGESPEVAARAFDGMWDEVVAVDDGDFMARFVSALRSEHPRLFRDDRPMAQHALDALESIEDEAEEEAAWAAIRERHPSRFTDQDGVAEVTGRLDAAIRQAAAKLTAAKMSTLNMPKNDQLRAARYADAAYQGEAARDILAEAIAFIDRMAGREG